MAAILSVPGLDNSGPDHWQTRWEEVRPDMRRVELGDWSQPDRANWVRTLGAAIAAERGPVLLVAHSLGCITVAAWALENEGSDVLGAPLVAPPDCDDGGPEGRIAGFAPVPWARLPFPSILVASRDDPYSTLPWSRALAAAWGSAFHDAGALGHINARSGLGAWARGARLLDQLIARVAEGPGAQP